MGAATSTRPASVHSLIQLVAAALLGFVAIPSLASLAPAAPGSGGPEAVPLSGIELALEAIVVIWILALTPALADRLAGQLGRLPGASPATALLAAVWATAFGYVLLAQALLRHSLVTVLGGFLDPARVEVFFAISVIVLLVAVLIRLYRVARPIVEQATQSALDVVIATSGSERADFSPLTVTSAAPTFRAAQDAVTLAATRAAANPVTRAPRVMEATALAPGRATPIDETVREPSTLSETTRIPRGDETALDRRAEETIAEPGGTTQPAG